MFTQTALVNEMGNLRKFAFRLTGNAFDADDLLQSTILRALEKKTYFQTGTNLFKWTSKIMFNQFVTAYRRKKKFETRYDPESYIDSASVEARQDTGAELRLVRDSMTALSDEHREILTLVCVEGLRYEEVADLLDIPIGTVRSRLSRARDQLQHSMDRRARERRALHADAVPYLPAMATPIHHHAATV